MYRNLRWKADVLAFARMQQRAKPILPGMHRASFIVPLGADEVVVTSFAVESERSIAVQLVNAHAPTDWRVAWRTEIDGMRLSQVEAVGARVLVIGGSPEGAVAALDRASGEEVWRTASRHLDAWQGARWVDGEHLITTCHAEGAVHVDALDAERGELVWSASFPRTRPAFRAMKLGPGRLLVPGDTTSVELDAATGAVERTLPFATLMGTAPGVVGTNDEHTFFLPHSAEPVDPRLLGPRADYTWWARTGTGDEGDVVLLDSEDRLTRHDARTGAAHWTLSLPGASGPVAHDARAPRLVAFAGAGPSGAGGLAIVDLDRGAIVRSQTTGGGLARVDAGMQVLCERWNEWRRVTLLDPGSGEPTRVTRVWSEPVLRGEGGSTSDLRFGRFWLTGPRAASPDAIDWAVFDPTSGEALWANGEVKIKRTAE